MYTTKQTNIPLTNSHHPGHTHTTSTIPNTGIPISTSSNTNYRKFQHRRIHTQLDEPVSSSNNYQPLNNNKYNIYQQQPNSAGLGSNYKKDYSKNRLNTQQYQVGGGGTGGTSSTGMYGGQIVSNTNNNTNTGTGMGTNVGTGMGTNNSQLSNRISTSNNNNNTTGTITKQQLLSNTNTNTSNISNTNTQNTNTYKNYKLLPKTTNTANLYSKILKTEPDAQDDNTSKQYSYRNKLKNIHSHNNNTQTNTNTHNNNTHNTTYNNNKYQIQGIAGKGTFGVVYFGKISLTGQKIAIKKVLQDKKYKNRQLQILKQVKHTNILQMKDYFITAQGNQQYLNVIMQYYSDNLYQVIKKKQISGLMIKLYTYQILRGLNYLTLLSIAHRDIKPQNILVDRNTHKVVICDFGSAKKLIKGQPNIAYICSRCYRAPQLIFGATQYTPQIDMWSAGCVIVQMINGQAPFLGDSQIDQLLEIIKILGTPQKGDIQQMNPKYDLKQYKKFPNIKAVPWRKILKTDDPLLVDLITKILEYSPRKRFTAAQAMKHPYFDQLKELNQISDQEYMKKNKIKCLPDLFNYTPDELISLGISSKDKDKQKERQRERQKQRQRESRRKQTNQKQREKSQNSKQQSLQSSQGGIKQVHQLTQPSSAQVVMPSHHPTQTTGKQIRQKVHGHSRTQSSNPTTGGNHGHVGGHISHIRNNSDFRDRAPVRKQYEQDFNINEDSIKIEKSIYTGSSGTGMGMSGGLGSGHKLIQRRIPASGMMGTGTGTGTGNMSGQGSSGIGANTSGSVNSSNYGKNTSSKRFEYR